MNYSYFFLSLLFVFSFTYPPFTSRKEYKAPLFQEGWVVLSGNIQHTDSNYHKVISLRFGDAILGGEEHFYAQQLAPENGGFEFRFRIFHPKEVLLDFQGKTLTLFVAQGDSLHFQVDAKDFTAKVTDYFPSLRFSSKQSRINEELLAFKRENQALFAYSNPEGKKAKDFYAQVLDSSRQTEIALRQYCTMNKSSSLFYAYKDQELLYTYANNLLDHRFYLMSNNIEGDENIFLPPIFNTQDFPLDPPPQIFSELYALHVFHTGINQFRSPEIHQLYQDGKNLDASLLFHESISQSDWKKEPQEILHYMLLRESLEREPEIFVQLWDKIGPQYIHDPAMVAYLSAKRVSLGGESPIHPVKLTWNPEEGSLLNSLLQQYQGKAVYLDIWATWCGPCLKEFPASMELQTQFENQPVAFVYLCLDPDPSQWEGTRQRFNLKGEHLYLDSDQSKQLKQELNFTGIPRYVLIDALGKIVDNHAPRPSDPEIRKAIEGLL